jgi:ATP-binding cassette subfamily B protein
MSEQLFDLRHTLATNRLRGMWRLVDGLRSRYLIAIGGLGLAALAQTIVFWLLGYVIDMVLPDAARRGELPWLALAFVGLALLQGTFSFGSGWLAANVSEKVARRLRDFLYDHIQRLTFSYHDRMQTGELLQRATSDVDTMRRVFAEQVVGIGRIGSLTIIGIIFLVQINTRLALVSVIIIPVILAVSVWFFRIIGRRYEAFQEQEAVLTNRLQESLSGVRVVKAFARQSYERDKFEVENMAKYHRGTALTRAHATYWPSTDFLSGIQLILAYSVGGMMVMDGTITIGQLVAAMGYLGMIIWPIRNLGRLIADLSTGLVSFGRISEIVKVVQEPLDEGDYRPNAPLRGEIIFENVSFAYEGEEAHALHDISFRVMPGQTIALLGSTGAGKSSLVGLLPRFYDYSSGRILLDGIDLRRYSRDWLRRQIGFVMQEPFLFAATIRDNIAYGVGRDVADNELVAAARAAAVHDVIQTFPDRYNTLVGERGVTLSGGQKQRTALARTFLINPAILVLDDATSAVDTETEGQIRTALAELTGDRTTFIIAHRIQSVMSADLILVLDRGRIVERGTHTELLALGGIYHRIHELQAGIEAELQAELAAA